LHNENGLAYKFWYKNRQIESEYWLDGKELTKEQFDNINKPRNNPKPCNNKTVEVDGVKYKLTAI